MAREKFLFFVGFSVDVDWIATSGRWTFKSKSVSSSRGEARPRHGKVVRKSQEFHTPLTRWQRERVVIDHDPFNLSFAQSLAQRARPRLPAIGLSLAEPLECAKQFCRRASCAPQVKALASLMVKRFQKRSRSQVRTVKNLRVSLPFHSKAPRHWLVIG